MNETAPHHKITVQIIWGIALVLAGIGVFYRIPEVMLRIEKIDQFASGTFFMRFSFYILGILLIGGGSKKVYENLYKTRKPQT